MVLPLMMSLTCTGPHCVEATAPVTVLVVELPEPDEPDEPDDEDDEEDDEPVPAVPVDTTALGVPTAWAPDVDVW
jgi:hypothetical protein